MELIYNCESLHLLGWTFPPLRPFVLSNLLSSLSVGALFDSVWRVRDLISTASDGVSNRERMDIPPGKTAAGGGRQGTGPYS